jgi:hypothetical protein
VKRRLLVATGTFLSYLVNQVKVKSILVASVASDGALIPFQITPPLSQAHPSLRVGAPIPPPLLDALQTLAISDGSTPPLVGVVVAFDRAEIDAATRAAPEVWAELLALGRVV